MTSTARFDVLDSWRGVCALLVAVMHLSTHFLYVPLSHAAITLQFYLFVDFFFVLSGFVIAHAYQANLHSSEDYWRFGIRRFGRLWPLHAAMFGVMVLLETAKAALTVEPHSPPFGVGWDSVASASNLLLTHAFGVIPAPNINGPSWSISAELWANLLFGLVIITARRWSAAMLGALCLACIVILWTSPEGRFLNVTTDYGLFRCLYGFVVGVFVYRLWLSRPNLRRIGTAEIPVVLLVCGYLPLTTWQPLTMLAPVVFAGVIFVFAHEAGPLSSMMRSRPMLRVGLWSYSIYLVHWPLFILLSRFVSFVETRTGATFKLDYMVAGNRETLVTFDSLPEQGSAALVAMALLIAVSGATYALIEAPGRSFFNALSRSLDRARRAVKT